MERIPLPSLSEQPAADNRPSPFPTGRRNQFIKQFHGPEPGSNIGCFKFWELVVAWGCPYECSYCLLQANPYARFNEQALTGLIYENYQRMLDEVELWLTEPTPRMLIVGELQDGLVFDNAYATVTGKPLTHHLVPLFAGQNRHRLIFLTKSTTIGRVLKLPPTPQVVLSWSVNAEYVGERWERGAPLPSRRFAAASKIKEAGWPIRFRLDPMIPYEEGTQNWREGYAKAIDEINALEPEMVTIGALRATKIRALEAAAAKNGRPTDVFRYLSEKDPSEFKYRLPFEVQLELFRFALDRLDQKGIAPALCKEDVSVWNALGLKFQGCHCLQGPAVPSELISSSGFLRQVNRNP